MSKPLEIFECQKGNSVRGALFCDITTKILFFSSPPPVATASALHNFRAEVMVSGGGEDPRFRWESELKFKIHYRFSAIFTH